MVRFMKVLFVYPNKVMATRIPFGIAYLASYLKRDGHNVRVFDTTFIKCGDVESDDKLRASSLQVRNPDFAKYGLVENNVDVFTEFDREINAFKPDMVAASVVDPNYSLGLELLRRAKSKHGILTVMGGATPTFAPDEVIQEECVDIICLGEGEEALCELCARLDKGSDVKDIKNLWVKREGRIYKNAIRPLVNVDELLWPDWDIFDQRHILRPLGGKIYSMGVFFTTRGCLFPCKYCGNLAFSRMYKDKGTFYRVKKPQVSIREISSYVKKYNLNFVFFMDDIFPIHEPEILDEFCRLYKKEVALPCSINLHPGLVREDAFAKIVDAGCCNICVGLESGSPRIRNEVLGRNYKNDVVCRIFDMARKHKIRSSSFNMIGIPRETREDIFQTIELNRRARPTTTTLAFFHPYRGTELRELCIKEKLFSPAKEREYESVTRVQSLLELPQISAKTLNGLFRTFQLYFKLPKVFYALIRVAEGDSFQAKFVYNMLKAIFYIFTYKDLEWDFSNKRGRRA